MADSYRAQTVDFHERRLKIREAQAKELDALESLFYEEFKTKDDYWYNRWKVQHEKTGIQEASIKSLECENKLLESENKSLRADLNIARAGHQDQQVVINGRSHRTSGSFEKIAKLKLLESEIQSLRAILGSNNDGIRGGPEIKDSLGDEALRVKYRALEGEFGRVTTAKDALESRCRRYKEILKEWREYEKIWIMRKGPRSAMTRRSLDSAVPPLEQHHGSNEIPAPPKPPAGSMPTPTNNQSTSTSPRGEIRFLQVSGQQQLPGRGGETSRSFEGATNTGRTIDVKLNELDGNETTGTAEEIDSRPTEVEAPQSPKGCWTTYLKNADPQPADENEELPVVVSERSLKRKRPSVKTEAQLNIHEAVNVKDEPFSNLSVIAVSSQPLSGVQDSLDLDDIRGSVDTPRKRERLVQMRLMSSLDDSFPFQSPTRRQVVTQKPDEDAVFETSTTEDEDDRHSQAPDSRLMGPNPPSALAPPEREMEDHEKKQRKAIRTSEQISLEGRVHKGRTPSASCDQYQSPASEKPRAPRSRRRPHQQSAKPLERVLLVPKDHNAPPRIRTGDCRSVRSSHRDRGAAQIPILAEDGKEFAPSKGPRHSPHVPSMLQAMLKGEFDSGLKDRPSNPHHRLGALLNDLSPEKAASPKAKPDLRLSKTAASPRTPVESCQRASVHRAQHNFHTAPFYKSNALDQHGVQPATTHSNPSEKNLSDKEKSPSLRNPPEVLPEHEPLRVRSVDRLRLSDFKLNKNHTEFAFHESVRKHDEKRRVGGCTDPFCDRCKEIARFAELTDYVAAPTATLFGSPPQNAAAAAAAAAEDKMLEEYLGPDKQRLRRMSGGERSEALKKARGKMFADAYGKHRQVHHRAVSPPGYWETEFPSTQQEAANREAARAIDRVRIKERYDEAMRGGLWKFADE